MKQFLIDFGARVQLFWENLGTKWKGACIGLAALAVLALGFGFGSLRGNMLQQSANSASLERETLTAQLEEHQQDIADQDTTISALEARLATLEAELEDANAYIEELHTQNQALADDLRAAHSDLAAERAEPAPEAQPAEPQPPENPPNDAGGQPTMVWVGRGDRYHADASCRNIKSRDPTQVTLEQALEEDYEPCKRCYG